MTTAEHRFQRLARDLLTDPAVTEGTAFGSTPGLRVGGKIFAMLGRDGKLVVKLPKPRVDELVESGTGTRFDPRHDGRVMREWVTVPARHGRLWEQLASDALQFVGPSPRHPSR